MIFATVSGNVGGDAELKNIGGSDVLNFSVAADSGFGDRKTTIWFSCALWGARGTKLQPYTKKGSKVTVVGELSQREYNGRTYLELRVADIKLQDSQGASQAQQSSPQQAAVSSPRPAGDDFDDVPF